MIETGSVMQKGAGAAGNEAYKGRYLILMIVLIGIFMAVLDGSIVIISLPTITGYFNVNVSQSQWVITSYLLVMTSLLLIFGRVSDFTGRARLFITGFFIFTISSLACGLSGDLYQLIFFRVTQAIGASMVFAISTAIIVQAFPKKERGRALGYVGTTVALGGITGPILGGFIVDSFGWRYIFLVNVPIGIALIFLAFWFLRLKEIRSDKLNMDWNGAIALFLSVVSLMIFLGDLSANGGVTIMMMIYAAVFMASFTALLYIESRQKSPILDFSFFRIRRFGFSNLCLLISFIAAFLFNFLMPFYFEGVIGYRPSQVGQILIIIPLVMAVSSPISGWIYDRYQSIYHSSAGILLMSLALFILSTLVVKADVGLILACFFIFGLGNGLFQSPNNSEVMSSLPMEKSGTASSVIATVRNLGMALGASFGSILLSFSLISQGFSGPVLDASPLVLAEAISKVLLAGGLISFIGFIISLLRR